MDRHGHSHTNYRQLEGVLPKSHQPAMRSPALRVCKHGAGTLGSTWSTRRQTTRATSASTPGGTLRRSPVPLGPERAFALHAPFG